MDREQKKNTRLKEARKAKHLTQKELADMVGVNLQSIYKYEAGIINPKMETGKKLSKVLGKSLSYLFGN